MKTVGKIIKESRTKKKISREKLEKLTKIKKVFIKDIEDESWENLPEFPVVLGFVKRIASTLKLDQDRIVSILRRDYPPKKLPVNPKPDVSESLRWSPKWTFLVGVLVVVVIIVGYLVSQYIRFINPPALNVTKPVDSEVVKSTLLIVKGTTDPDATIKVNNQSVIVEEDGRFVAEINIFEGTSEVEVIAKSRSGKTTTVNRKIIPELE